MMRISIILNQSSTFSGAFKKFNMNFSQNNLIFFSFLLFFNLLEFAEMHSKNKKNKIVKCRYTQQTIENIQHFDFKSDEKL